MKQNLTSFLLIFFVSLTQAQNTYLVKSDNVIYRLNSDSTLTNIVTISNLMFPAVPLTGDIALSPSNIFYGITDDGQNGQIIQINGNNNYTVLTTLPAGGWYNSLVCSHNYELYFIQNIDGNNGANSKLYKYNILTNTTELVTIIGFNTPGDITFYKGNLIFLASSDDKIKAYNLENGTLTDIFCLPSQYNNMTGIAGIFTSCDSTIIRTCDGNGVREINFSTNSVSPLLYTNTMYDIYGLTSDNDFLSSGCSFQFQTASCALSTNTNYSQNSAISIFPNPFIDNIHIKNNEEINFMEIYDVNGRLILKILSPKAEINIENLDKGVYFFKINTESGFKTNKIIKL